MLVVTAHVPAVGVKVYVVVDVLFVPGLHIPVILLFEVVGKLKDSPLHTAETWVKVGVTLALMVNLTVFEVAVVEAKVVKIQIMESAFAKLLLE
jgi:hypothetical protein